ncbi:MAG TPA: hypothetical protein VMA72_11710 [Streptosporangiaceae bacterium]|nr:hypothetical protein [Streptosporangiaceae bacterium]
MSHQVRTRVICRIFVRATPRAVWDAICPALKQSGGYVSLAAPAGSAPGDQAASARRLSGLVTIGGSLEAVYFELRDTMTGYTAVTVSHEPSGPPGVPEPCAVSAHDWDQLLGEVKTLLEAQGRELVPQVQALSRRLATARLTGACLGWGRGASGCGPVPSGAGPARTAGGAARTQTRSQPVRRARQR